MFMAGDRGDDIVLAGSAGQRASATLSALFDQTHRSTSLILAIDSIIIVLISQQVSTALQPILGSSAMLLWAVPLFICVLTWFSYRSRRSWAYWPAAAILAIASVIFFILFLQYLYFLYFLEDLHLILPNQLAFHFQLILILCLNQ